MAQFKIPMRRSFFTGLGVVAAAGVALKLTPTTAGLAAEALPPAEPEGDGYRLTEHVKKYYRTTTI